MADLEEKGYLRQTHVSSGRVPTDLGYRYYVDEIVGAGALQTEGLEEIRQRLGRRLGIPELIREASRTLSAASHQAGLVRGPRLIHARFEHLELRRVAPHRVLAIFVTSSRLVQTHLLELQEDVQQEDLDAMSRVWDDRFANLTLSEVRSRLIAVMAEEGRLRHAANWAWNSAGGRWRAGSGGGALPDGAANILGDPGSRLGRCGPWSGPSKRRATKRLLDRASAPTG
jgi:heat-inducible transcriptional repressor